MPTTDNMRREIATTIAALRYWQAGLANAEGNQGDLIEVATDLGKVEALTVAEIDDLVQRLQFEGGDSDAEPAPIVIEVTGGVADVTKNPPNYPVEIIDHDNDE